jgi:lysozyme family protein
MRRLHPLLIVMVFGMMVTATGHAIVLNATLTNDQENPPAFPLTTSTGAPRPASFGTAVFTLDDSLPAMSFTATIFNIDVTGTQTPDTNDNLVAAHIHASATVTPTTNAPVVWGFFGDPFNDDNPNDFNLDAFDSGVGGVFSGKWDATEGNNTNLTEQLNNILTGRSYLNFHTVQFRGGEIRGAIVPETSSTLAMLAAALVALLGLRRRVAR